MLAEGCQKSLLRFFFIQSCHKEKSYFKKENKSNSNKKSYTCLIRLSQFLFRYVNITIFVSLFEISFRFNFRLKIQIRFICLHNIPISFSIQNIFCVFLKIIRFTIFVKQRVKRKQEIFFFFKEVFYLKESSK